MCGTTNIPGYMQCGTGTGSDDMLHAVLRWLAFATATAAVPQWRCQRCTSKVPHATSPVRPLNYCRLGRPFQGHSPPPHGPHDPDKPAAAHHGMSRTRATTVSVAVVEVGVVAVVLAVAVLAAEGGRRRTAPPVAAPTTCSFVGENQPLNLACGEGEMIRSVDTAIFGTFPAGSGCTGNMQPTTTCPTIVAPQIDRLCKGNNNCSATCWCGSPTLVCMCRLGALSVAFPGFPCQGSVKSLAVTVTCGPALPVVPPATAASPSPTLLRLAFLQEPLGVDELRPQFSWQPAHAGAGARQAAASVQAAFVIHVVDAARGAEVWSSGQVNSSQPFYVPGTDLPLLSDRPYRWTVATLGAAGWSATSDPANFTTGLLHQSDWGEAKWITPNITEDTAGDSVVPGTLLRFDFDVPADLRVKRASALVSACQYYRLYVDGERVGRSELDVLWTRFDRNRSYSTYDLPSSLFAPGLHTIGLVLGQGFCGESAGKAGRQYRAGILRLSLYATEDELSGAASVVIVTNSSWQAGAGPITADSTYYGTAYDARRVQQGWSTHTFKPAAGRVWGPATELVYVWGRAGQKLWQGV